MAIGQGMGAGASIGVGWRRASWIDRVHTLVDRLPGPVWLPYLVVWLLLASVETVVKWSVGAYPMGTFFPFHLVAMGTAVYGLGFLHLLDARAGRALDTLRPSLDLSDADVAEVRRRLTTMPELGVVLAMLVGAAYGAAQLAPLVSPSLAGFRYGPSGPLLVGELFVMVFVLWGVVATFLYHAVRQVRIIDCLYQQHTQVDLFDARPLTSFSSYSALMAIGIVLMGYLWVAVYPRDAGAVAYSLQVMIVVLLFIISALAFFRPIWSGHKHLARLKRERLQACHGALDCVGRDLRTAIAARDYRTGDAFHHTVAAMTSDLARVEKVSTWPWKAESVSPVLTAVLLPLIVWVVQQYVGRVLMP